MQGRPAVLQASCRTVVSPIHLWGSTFPVLSPALCQARPLRLGVIYGKGCCPSYSDYTTQALLALQSDNQSTGYPQPPVPQWSPAHICLFSTIELQTSSARSDTAHVWSLMPLASRQGRNANSRLLTWPCSPSDRVHPPHTVASCCRPALSWRRCWGAIVGAEYGVAAAAHARSQDIAVYHTEHWAWARASQELDEVYEAVEGKLQL